jgi:alcohol dehydrogenase class IV
LTEYGLTPDAFDLIAEESLPSGSTKANPRPVTQPDLIDLLSTVV